MKDLKNYNLLAHNTFGIAGLCRRFVEFGDVDDVQTFVRTLTEADRPLLIIGAGSNLLLTRDFTGTVLHSAIKGREVVKRSDKKRMAALWLRRNVGRYRSLRCRQWLAWS